MNVRRMPSAPPNSPASNPPLSGGGAWPDWDASVVVQSSWANTNAAKSTSRESSTSRSSVDRPGLNVVVQGSTSATSSRPRVIALSNFVCWPDDPRKTRGLFTQIASAALSLRSLGDRLDELPGFLVLREGDVGLGDDADEPAVLDDRQPPNLVAGHELKRLVEVSVGLDGDEIPRGDVSDRRPHMVAGLRDHPHR